MSKPRRKRKVKDLEFAVDNAAGDEQIFDLFVDASAFAIMIAVATGKSVNLDVLCWSRNAAKVWGGDDGAATYDQDPDASVHERIVVKAEGRGRVA